MESTENNNIVYVVGDSHAGFYGKIDFCKPTNIGTILAWTFKDKKEVSEYLDKNCPKGSWILFCFGEVDCRWHLWKNINVKDCVDRYVEGLRKFKNEYKLILVGPVATTWLDSEELNSEYPSYRTHVMRNVITRHFNDWLEYRCFEEKIPFITVFPKLINEDFVTKKEYYGNDSVHLYSDELAQELKEKILFIIK
jgi:hypothetical protein